jgi:LPS-assembly protein
MIAGSDSECDRAYGVDKIKSVNLSRPLLSATAAITLLIGSSARAQGTPEAAPPLAENEIGFSANALDFNQETGVVTASGDVRATRDGNKLRADRVVWDRKTGEVRADGNVIIIGKTGDTAYGDSVVVTDTLRDGVVDNMLVVLEDGGRLVAARGTRKNGVSTLERASYSPCRVIDDKGCPKDPVWKITAVEVVHDPVANKIRYKDARLELFGLPVLALPGLSHPADNRGGTGALVPDVRYTQANGFELSVPYYFLIDRNRDLTVTPHVYSKVLPAAEIEYRALTGNGAYKVEGALTYGSRIPTAVAGTARERGVRGYLGASGKFQLDPRWSVTGAGRVTTDRTFLRRYDISRDDRLRSTIDIERVTRTSYFSVSGWAFQTLRPGDSQGQIPIALPAVDYRKRMQDPLIGGQLEFQLNSLTLLRTAGQDTQRAFAGGRWDLRRITGMGQEVQLTGYVRADAYHTDDSLRTTTAAYRGRDGWNTRLISAAAAEARWPLVGPFLGGTQRITPRVQIVASPSTRNLNIPNEDARAVDLEDSNLFALNRFAGYDRWEDGTRMTYGVDWAVNAPGFRVEANIGQSYRLTSKPTLFPDGTGLTNRTSDVVGRTTVKFKKLVSLTHRYRLDKDNFAIRRNELDATIGTDKTYGVIGYLRLNRNIGPQLEDLRDREEVRLGGRIQVARYWSVFGSTIIDLTGQREDPISLADGFEPVRHRLGIQYEDDCVTLGLTWRRDYDASGDARRGNTYQLRLSFRNLGR